MPEQPSRENPGVDERRVERLERISLEDLVRKFQLELEEIIRRNRGPEAIRQRDAFEYFLALLREEDLNAYTISPVLGEELKRAITGIVAVDGRLGESYFRDPVALLGILASLKTLSRAPEVKRSGLTSFRSNL